MQSRLLCFRIRTFIGTRGLHQMANTTTKLIMNKAVRSNFKRSVQDDRAYRGANCASDHNLVIAKTLLKLVRKGKRVEKVKRYETSKLTVPEIKKQFSLVGIKIQIQLLIAGGRGRRKMV